MQFAMKTDTGLVRSANEDACMVGCVSETYVWGIVCDGMGGALAGEIASKTAVDEIVRRIKRAYRRDMSEMSAGYLLKTAITSSGIAIYDDSQSNPEHEGMGTTTVACLMLKNSVVCASIGDSRAYVLNKSGLTQITHDHSLVQELIDAGRLTEEEALHYPHRNIITRVLGTEQSVDVDLFTVPFAKKDRILLCTDGLTNMVSADTIEQVLRDAAVEEIPNILIDEANKNGGVDNIAVVVIEK